MRKQGKEHRGGILKVLKAHGWSMSACEVLEAIKREETNLSAPTVHRARSALRGTGAAHTLGSLTVFAYCQCDLADHTPVFVGCTESRKAEKNADRLVKDRLADILSAPTDNSPAGQDMFA